VPASAMVPATAMADALADGRAAHYPTITTHASTPIK